jgi:hypothetical protein
MSDRNPAKTSSTKTAATKGGEGNRVADRNYRQGVRKTVSETTEQERSNKARDISDKELKQARKAEKEGKSHAKR